MTQRKLWMRDTLRRWTVRLPPGVRPYRRIPLLGRLRRTGHALMRNVIVVSGPVAV
jgi:hypothetical protein